MNIDILVVPAQPDDVWDMQHVYREAWLATYPNPAYGVTCEHIEDMLRKQSTPALMEHRRLLLANPPRGEARRVAKVGGKLVGLCSVSTYPKKNKLKSLYVLPEYHRQGIGTALWQDGRKYLNQRRDIEVWAAEYNLKAISFYKKLDFVETKERDQDAAYIFEGGARIPEIKLILKPKPTS